MKNKEILRNLELDFENNIYENCEKFIRNKNTVYLTLDFISNYIKTATNGKTLKELSIMIHKANVKNSPEAQSLLADIYLDLALLGYRNDLLLWCSWKAHKAVEIKLTRNDLIIHPEMLLSKKITDTIFRSVSSISIKQLVDPINFLETIVKVKNRDIQLTALKLINDSIKEEIFTPLNTYDLYFDLLNSEFDEIILEVINSLNNTWIKPKQEIIYKLKSFTKHDIPKIQEAAVKLLITWKASDALELILEDKNQTDIIKYYIIEAMGSFGSQRLLSKILHIANTDVLFYGEACIKSLLLFHARTIFIEKSDFDLLFNIYLNTLVSAKDIEILTYVNRYNLFYYFDDIFKNEELEDNKYILRAIELISIIKVPKVYDLLEFILEQNADNNIIRKELIKLIAHKANKNAEDILLSYLEKDTKTVIDSLKYVATSKTYNILYETLGFSSEKEISHNFLHPFYKEALALLWHLAQNKKERSQILLRLNPTEIPNQIERDLGSTINQRELELLIFRKDKFIASDMITKLCNYELVETIPLISELFIKYIEELSTDSSDENDETDYYNYSKEAVVSDTIKKAIINLGKALYKKGKIRPIILAYANNQAEAGDLFLSEMVISIIKDNDLSSTELRILLEVLESVDFVKDIERIQKLINHDSPDVRKMIIRALVKQDSIGFLPVFDKLIESDDIETSRQAIIAISHFEKTNLTNSVVNCLENRNMNIKKTAAKALRNIKSEYSAQRLMFWLSFHDNPGLRNEILLSLESIYTSFLPSVIISEIEELEETRRKKLLVLALDNRLKLSTFKNLLKIKNTSAELIINALYRGEIGLKDAVLSSLDTYIKSYCKNFDFEAELNYVGKKTVSERKNIEKSSDDILVYGWSNRLAHKLLKSEKKASKKTSLILKVYLKEWLHFISTLKGDNFRKACSFLADFDLTYYGEKKHYEILSQNYNIIINAIEGKNNDSFNHKLVKLLNFAITKLNKLSKIEIANRARTWKTLKQGNGQERYNLLKACNILLSPSDILICIKDCLFTSNPKLFMKTILKDAFKVKDNLNDIDLRDPSYALLNFIDSFVSLDYNDEEKQMDLLKTMETLQPLSTFSLNFEKPSFLKTKNENILASFSKRDEYFDLLLSEDEELTKKQKNKIVSTLLTWPEISSDFELILDLYLEDKIDLSEIKNSKIILGKFIGEKNQEELVEKIEALNVSSKNKFLEILYYSSKETIKSLSSTLIKLWKSDDIDLSQNAKKCLRLINPNSLIPFVTSSLKNREYSLIDILSKGIIRNNETNEILEVLKKETDHFYLNKFKELLRNKVIYLPNDQEEAQKLLAFDTFKKKTKITQKNTNIDLETDIYKIIELTDSRDIDKIKLGIKAMVNHQGDDRVVIEALENLCTKYPSLKVRSLAHRALKKRADKETYLNVTLSFLYDPRDTVKCAAMKTLSFATYYPAMGYIIGYLTNKEPILRKAALESIVLYGEPALNTILKRRKTTRPDKKEFLTVAIETILEEARR